MKKFIPFTFDGNLYFGDIDSPDDVKKLLTAYDYLTIRKAKELGEEYSYRDKDDKKSFGFYYEYQGKLTLGEWIDKNKLNGFFDLQLERREKLRKLIK